MGAVFAVHAACIRGVEAVPITVEVSMSQGLPGITILGMADMSVRESRGRVRSALRSAGFDIPRRNIVVNLAPSDMRKSGSSLDLPIAVAILAVSADSLEWVGRLPVYWRARAQRPDQSRDRRGCLSAACSR